MNHFFRGCLFGMAFGASFELIEIANALKHITELLEQILAKLP